MPWNSIVEGCVQGNDVVTLACLPALFSSVINALFGFAGVTALILIIYSGIKFMASGGDPKQVEGARKTLTYAVIGLIIIFFAYFIINLISYFTGVQCIKAFGFESCK